MINHILLLFLGTIIYEFIRYVNFKDIFKANIRIYKKILELFNYKNVSDFRKEKLIFYYSKSLSLISLKIFSIIIAILIFLFLLSLISKSFLNLIISLLGIMELSIFIVIYHLLRKKMIQSYSNLQKFLHDLVLSKKFINKSLFEIEKNYIS